MADPVQINECAPARMQKEECERHHEDISDSPHPENRLKSVDWDQKQPSTDQGGEPRAKQAINQPPKSNALTPIPIIAVSLTQNSSEASSSPNPVTIVHESIRARK